jgi:hypothetical protein
MSVGVMEDYKLRDLRASLGTGIFSFLLFPFLHSLHLLVSLIRFTCEANKGNQKVK